jgi:hypothetical protein
MSDRIGDASECVRKALTLRLAVVSGSRRGESREASFEASMERKALCIL